MNIGEGAHFAQIIHKVLSIPQLNRVGKKVTSHMTGCCALTKLATALNCNLSWAACYASCQNN